MDRAWELTSQMRAREADDAFRPLAVTGSREAALGAALAQLELPPFSTVRLGETRRQLQALLAVNGDDETGIRARFLLGRLRQLHDHTEGTVDAPELMELSRDHPEHYLAQLAVIKLVLHRLYATLPDNPDAGRFEKAEQAGACITNPELQRDFHIMMGDTYLFFGDQRGSALLHYHAAEVIGIADSALRATVLVQIGELARLEGQTALAATAYRKFIGEFGRDIRVFEVRKRLAMSEGAP